jgi:hypothetical protein
MAIQFETDSPVMDRALDVKPYHLPEHLKPADPRIPPPRVPELDMQPRRHDVVRWDQEGAVTKTSHETKEAAVEYAHALHWATTWKWCIMCGREFVERRELFEPADYQMAVRRFLNAR